MAMRSYVALLRAVNLAGVNRIAMSELRELVASLGYDDVKTLLNSGNVVFRGPSKPAEKIERQLETETKRRVGIDTAFIVRSADEWLDAISGNPFRKEAERDPGHLIALFAKDAVRPGNVKTLQAAIVGREVVRGGSRHVYVVYPDGIGRSKLTIALIEKKLGVRCTGRNWNTVVKLKELACG
jgi:uncharacterized protein (DUF1697 family)